MLHKNAMLINKIMTMHWGQTLGNKQTNVFKPQNKIHNHSVGFPYNATKYLHSEEKLIWDQIWDEAMNHSLANRSSTYMQNVYMQKTRLLSDMIDHKVHPHSFTMVMVIASMFLFFTLAITVAVVVFCRKKNMVFAFQKSEQEDDGEYELDDMDTNTDMEYGSDNDTDIESGSPKKHYGQYLQVNNPTSGFKPLMYVSNCSTSTASDEQTANSSPIYKPKRPLYTSDKRGAYQPVNITAQLEICNENAKDDNIFITSDTLDSPRISITKKQCKGNSYKRSGDVAANRITDNDLRSNCKCCNGDIPVISISNVDQLANNYCNNNNTTTNNRDCESPHKYQPNNNKSWCVKAEVNNRTDEVIQIYNQVKDCPTTKASNCDKYDTEISLVGNNIDSTNCAKIKNYTDMTVVRLAGIKSKSNNKSNSSEKKQQEEDRDTKPLISPSSAPSNQPCDNSLDNSRREACQSEEVYSHAMRGTFQHIGNDEQCVTSTINGQFSLQSSPVKDFTTAKKANPTQGGCQSLPSTPHDESCVQTSMLKQLRQHWVTFDEAVQ